MEQAIAELASSAFAAIGAICFLLFVVLAQPILGLWLQAMLSGARIELRDLIAMRFRKVDARIIVLNRIRAMRAGLDLPARELEAQHPAGGDIARVVSAMIASRKAGILLGWDDACARDLAGEDVFETVNAEAERRSFDDPERGETRILHSEHRPPMTRSGGQP
ncbi:MAG: flotillin-like FloA family protein [Phycisphaeraceae bacterium]|nr:MAG: flotillin-like FloA family protein [Phycisphaeraceae bacterium]